MKTRALIAALALLPGLAFAQGHRPGGSTSVSTGLAPATDLGASLGTASKRFLHLFAGTLSDGNSINRMLFGTGQGTIYVDGLTASGGATDVANIFNTHVIWTDGRIACFSNAGTEKLCITYQGKIAGTWATPQLIDMSSGGNGIRLSTGTNLGGDIFMGDLFNNNFLHVQNSGLTQGTVENPVPVVHQAQTGSPVAMEFGKAAATGGALAVTFATAFASAPTCNCTGTNASASGCVISTPQNTTTVTFTFGAGTDVIDWQCTGAK